MTYASVRVGALVLCALFPAGTVPRALGQTAPAQEWSLVMMTVVKPEMRVEYEAAVKELTAAYRKAGVRSRAVLQTVFGNMNEYVLVTPIARFAEMDGTGPLDRVLGAEAAAKLRNRAAGMTVSMRRIASLGMPDLSIRTPAEPAPYAHVITYTLAPGKAGEFAAFMKDDFLPVLRKGQIANFWVSRGIFGAESMERVTVRPVKKLADLDEGPIAQRVLGAEGAAKLNAKTAALFQSVHHRIVRYRADLSYGPEPTKVSQR